MMTNPNPATCALIRDEHRTLAALLHALKHLVREIRAGRATPDFALLRAIVYYIDAFPEKFHHPKEETFLFTPLARRSAEAAAMIASLRAEHAEGEARILGLQHVLLRYEQEGSDGFAPFAAAVDDYAAFYYRHMEKEERDVIPLALRVLLPADWAAADRAFMANRDPLNGSVEGEFRQLFSKIINLAPPPIGVGPERRVNGS